MRPRQPPPFRESHSSTEQSNGIDAENPTISYISPQISEASQSFVAADDRAQSASVARAGGGTMRIAPVEGLKRRTFTRDPSHDAVYPPSPQAGRRGG